LLVSDFVQQTSQYRLVVYPLSPSKSTRVIPISFPMGVAAYDSEDGLWHNLQSTSPTTGVLTSVNISSGVTASSVNVQCGNIDKIWVEARHPDFTSRCEANTCGVFFKQFFFARLWGVRANFSSSLTYDLVNINLTTGACQSMSLPSGGIITAFAFDQHNGVLFYNDATDGGNFLRRASVRDGKTSSLKLLNPFTFSDLAVRFVE
jgi:hypothetical protein